MSSSPPKRFRPTPSAAISTLALIFAVSGGAYAASKYLITSTKQISPSVLRALKGASGKPGPVGAAGPTGVGTAGSVGPPGPAGAAGPAGPQGEQGEPGRNGKPGKEGKEGKEGSAWTAGGTLPIGSTETGVWTMGESAAGTVSETIRPVRLRAALSFSIPLAAPIEESNVHIFEGTAIPSPGCSGTVVEERVHELKADSGNLCVWLDSSFSTIKAGELSVANIESFSIGAGTHGAMLFMFRGVGEGATADGTWAVTG